jgi:hypothetical protein
MTETCETCENTDRYTTWAPAWQIWLCTSCRYKRVEQELLNTHHTSPRLSTRLPAPKGELGGPHP